MKSLLVFVILLVTSSSLYAIDSKKCSKMLNDGLWRKYRYGGMGEAYWNACTQGTKKEGSSTVTSDATTEGTTTAVDTKYTSNVWTSQTQSTSSWGECNAFAQVEQLKKDREVYMAQNEHEVLIDIARGNGEHLKVITFYSACAPEAYTELGSKLKASLSKHNALPDVKTLCNDIDLIITQSDSLKQACFSAI
jgi:hypothetical protein